MIKAIFRLIFRLFGWKMNPNIPPEVYQNCVVMAAPHTALSDAVFTIGAFTQAKMPVRFAVKKESNVFLLGPILKAAGALWIDRSPRNKGDGRRSYIEVMVELFETDGPHSLIIAPEGTRSLVTEWKSGAYQLAKAAGVPIALGYLDFPKKEAGIGPIIHPGEDMEADMKKIMAFYQTKTGKYPAKFSLDQRYAP